MDSPIKEHQVSVALRSKVRECTSGAVVQALELITYIVEVPFHGRALPLRSREVVAETGAGGESIAGVIGDHFGIVHGTANSRNIGTRSRERRHKSFCVFAIVGHASRIRANPEVTRSEEQRDTLSTQRSELIAYSLGIALGYCLLMIAIRGGDHIGNSGDVLVAEIEKPGEVGLVGVGRGELVS